MADDTHLYCGFMRFSSSRWLPCVRVVWSRVFLCVCAPFCFCCPIWSRVVFVLLLCFSSFLVLCCGCPCSAVLGRDLAVATASAGHGSVCFRLCVLSFPCCVAAFFGGVRRLVYDSCSRVGACRQKKGGSRRLTEAGDGQEKLGKAKKGDRVGPERAVDGEERGAHGAVFRLRGAEVSEAKPSRHVARRRCRVAEWSRKGGA